MQAKDQIKTSTREIDLTEGAALNQHNDLKLSEQKQKFQQEKQEIQEFWKDQLQQKQLLKLKENEAAKAIKGI
eukprot:CAMPEP_0176381342 /NCGR_PEP_ID=MMETSP0126-20121128/31818_1 /TAXON_ID=141414 ORGANISM="Strombidinopsis acuminatum, Strain SPMC142" /NCGR_SAMPLE_ID=MMETSP0126 /ASSEMBLY_ACC=CAM_ASM_000229 /LENGTH=72 /DNA_ID=CAMNT_0017745135 /DNA_START=1401 /DNA_END=1619 /DNA_ORIENTATION=+